jgi:D-alanyl-D-alanine carboxypeptidase
VIPVTDEENLPVQLPVLGRTTDRRVQYLKLRYRREVGWLAADQTRPASSSSLTLRLRQRLSAIINAAGPRSGAMISDPSGRVLWQRRALRSRILASNTKLYVTAAATDVYGNSVYPLLRRILQPSDNALAQQLLVRLGRGRAEAGLAATESFADDMDSVVTLADGSGLSRRNRATPADVVALLVGMRMEIGYSRWRDALPVAGRTGTLAARMRGTSADRACQAKTGTLRDVSTLSGYCTTRSGRRIVFSLLMNQIAPLRARNLQDRALTSLTSLG